MHKYIHNFLNTLRSIKDSYVVAFIVVAVKGFIVIDIAVAFSVPCVAVATAIALSVAIHGVSTTAVVFAGTVDNEDDPVVVVVVVVVVIVVITVSSVMPKSLRS